MSYHMRNKVMLPSKKQFKHISTKILSERDVDYNKAVESKLHSNIQPQPEKQQEKKGSGLSSLSQKLSSLKVNDNTPIPAFQPLPNTRKRNIAFVL